MGNFDFVRQTQPLLAEDAARAETYVTTDPRTAAIYTRRVAEHLVLHLYDLWQLPTPYQNDFSARLNEREFVQRVPLVIRTKLDLIRRQGNNAVHRSTPVTVQAGTQLLSELFHVLVWAGQYHSPYPEAVPVGSQFDVNLAANAAPLTPDQVRELAKRFAQQDQNHAVTVAEKNALLAERDAEIALLQQQIAAAQAAKTIDDRHDYQEDETRSALIDAQLGEAGWGLTDERDREFKVTGMPTPSGDGYVDYVLWGDDGLPLAVVEAKRTSKSPQIGEHQASLYADSLEERYGRRPVIFTTNGYEHALWDDAAGYPPRRVDGFFTKAELELMVQRRATRQPLANAPISTDIAGRPYQQRAIRAVGDAFDQKQRTALLVMATGSGKTRTTIALVDQLVKQNWVKRVLFLADRTSLVKQATRAFTTHLPDATTVNLVTERTGEGRVYAATYPTMLNIINQVDNGTRRFTPGHFDLIVVDEAHRSVYDKYGAIFDYFDGLLVGLTATPKNEIDRNTYGLFDLEDGVPTDAYTLEEAVADGYLVPPRGVAVESQFLRQGIKYDDLSPEERDQWDLLDWGDDGTPDEVTADDVNRVLFNIDTVDKVIRTLMEQGYKVSGGDTLGKTIVFAKNQAHAEFIRERFDASYPEYGGKFARVITHATTYAQQLIDDFSDPTKLPQIAISVDMLDTGIDVPDVVNLVFFKTVRSKAKFWQMIGRGTRLRQDLFGPGEHKTDFLVFDFCGNLEYFSQDLPETSGSTQRSLTQRLVEHRLQLLGALSDQAPELRSRTTKLLHDFVCGMNLDNVVVRRNRELVDRFTRAEAWAHPSPTDLSAAAGLAILPSAFRDDDEFAKRFDLIILRRQLAQLEGDALTAERARETVQAIAQSLLGKLSIPMIAEHTVLLEAVASEEWWVDVTLEMLDLARLRLRGLARFIDRTHRSPVYTNFEDTISDGVEVALATSVTGTDMARFREKAQVFLRDHEDHLALQRLRRNMQLTESDLESLERMLLDAGVATSVQLGHEAEAAGGLGIFIRSLVGLDRPAVTEAFIEFLDEKSFTVQQLRFIDLIIDELTNTGVMEPGRLFQPPYIDTAPTGPTELFTDEQALAIVSTLRMVRSRAIPDGTAISA